MNELTQNVTLGREAREKLIAGVDVLANAVKATLGPRGRNVVIEGAGMLPRITKDGVTVARSITLKDPIENLGCTVVKQASSKTNDLAGDGTTSSTVLAQALVNEGNKLVTAGEDPVQLKREMDDALSYIKDYLKGFSTEIKGDQKKIQSIATISANNDPQIGDTITQAFDYAGEDGVILVDQSKTGSIYLERLPGLQFDKGMKSPYFATDLKKMKAEYENAYVLIYDGKISSPKGFEKILDAVLRTSKPLLIIADEFDPQTLNILVVNKIRAGFKVAAVQSPAFGQRRKKILEDMAVMTGGKVISEDFGLTIDKVGLEDLGQVKKLEVTKTSTTLVDGKGSEKEIKERIALLRDQINNEETEWGKEKVKERIAKLGKGIVIIRVGAATDVEVGEMKDRIDDSLRATRAALQEGIVPGGGSALLNVIAQASYDDGFPKTKGAKLLLKACEYPLRTICQNAGKSGEAVVDQLLELKNPNSSVIKDKLNYGYDAGVGKYVEMDKEGIIDPTKVVRVALENAVSVAGMLITTECAVSNAPMESPYDPEMIAP